VLLKHWLVPITVALFVVFTSSRPVVAAGQQSATPQPTEVTTSKAGPVYRAPRDSGVGTQLAVFGRGATLTLLDIKGEWYHVRLVDRSGKHVVGYTHVSFLDVPQPERSTTPAVESPRRPATPSTLAAVDSASPARYSAHAYRCDASRFV